MEDLQSLYDESYAIYKSKKAELKSGKTPEEIKLSQKKKNENRYSKMLKDKKLTQDEYEILLKYNNEK